MSKQTSAPKAAFTCSVASTRKCLHLCCDLVQFNLGLQSRILRFQMFFLTSKKQVSKSLRESFICVLSVLCSAFSNDFDFASLLMLWRAFCILVMTSKAQGCCARSVPCFTTLTKRLSYFIGVKKVSACYAVSPRPPRSLSSTFFHYPASSICSPVRGPCQLAWKKVFGKWEINESRAASWQLTNIFEKDSSERRERHHDFTLH